MTDTLFYILLGAVGLWIAIGFLVHHFYRPYDRILARIDASICGALAMGFLGLCLGGCIMQYVFHVEYTAHMQWYCSIGGALFGSLHGIFKTFPMPTPKY